MGNSTRRLPHYFHTREQIYESLLREAHSHKADEVLEVAKQLQRFLVSGLLDGPVGIRSLTIDPHAPAAVAGA